VRAVSRAYPGGVTPSRVFVGMFVRSLVELLNQLKSELIFSLSCTARNQPPIESLLSPITIRLLQQPYTYKTTPRSISWQNTHMQTCSVQVLITQKASAHGTHKRIHAADE
jgi:hypothetical protein